jgi:hypothetical protein
MTLLLGILFFVALAVIAVIHSTYGEDDAVRRCPSCGLESLYPRGDDVFSCARCGARYRRGFDGRMVPA